MYPPAVRSACPYCGVGCGVLARPDGRGGATVSGDPDHPANFGRLCSKGFALGETLSLEGRLLHPMRRQADGTLARVSWDEALDRVADGFGRTVAQHGPEAVAFYLSGQLLTEDYYVANKLMKGFIGSANVDTNSRLCMASSVAAHRRAFGADVVPGSYEDLDEADLIVLVGSNAAWCHPVLYQRMVRNRSERGAKIVVIDPRRTVTGEDADLFLAVAPGMDTALFCGLLVHLAETGALDLDYVAEHTTGFDAALARAREIAPDPAGTAAAAGVDAGDLQNFFELFATTEKVVTCFSQGVNQSAQGTDKANAIINCHLATGRIGRPGRGPFSLTGQPNAMGGREVGGLANLLAAHMGFVPREIDRVRRFWNAPRIATREGRKAVAMFEAIGRGEIKALWVMGTNPAVSLPRAGAARAALSSLDLLVVSDNVMATDTIAAGAHVLLPAAAWGEKDGTVTNSERAISRQRAFLSLPGEAKPDWWIVAQVAQRLGFADAFAYRAAADIFREHAALSCFENDGARAFDLGALASLSDQAYAALDPVQWPRRAGGASEQRLFASGGFLTPDRKARFVAPEPPALAAPVSPDLPLRLNTGRVRDQWHTMTRTGRSASLGLHRPAPFVEVHPLDAAACGLKHDGYARVRTAHGACVLKVVVAPGQRRGSIFVPIHWSDETAACARVGELVGAETDPFSGQPELKATPAALERVEFAFQGFALARDALRWPGGTWWARLAVGEASGYLFATDSGPSHWHVSAPDLFGEDAVLTQYVDRARGVFRGAAFRDGRLAGCMFLHRSDAVHADAIGSDIAHVPAAATFEPSGRGEQLFAKFGPLPVVCACFEVGLQTIREAMVSRSAASVEDIGRALRAGTKCGSCLPELRSLAHEHLAPAV
jgi:assimilatory nitrate reductase catalytic subunit